jgi:surfeit locus 1 family protein
MLLFALAVAAVFAWLGQWQFERAIDTNPPPPDITEEVQAIGDVVAPGDYLPEPLVGQRVEVSGYWIAEDFIVVSTRFNEGVEGYWVTGQLRVAERTSLAVAVGWAPDRSTADSAVVALRAAGDAEASLIGRLISDEGPSLPPRAEPDRIDRMSPPALLSRWHDTEQLKVYRPYLASATAPAGLVDISSKPPEPASAVNWLNVFYAAEWVVFAGMAFYLWYRLARDAWERELEEFDAAKRR